LAAFAAAFLLVPGTQALAATGYGGYIKVHATGTGSGEAVSFEEPGLWFPSRPPIACKYNGITTSGTCEGEVAEALEEGTNFFVSPLEARPAPGSEFGGWTVQKGAVEGTCPSSEDPARCVVSGVEEGSDELEVTAEFVGIPFELTLFVNGADGAGTVTSAPSSAINCSAGQECSAGLAGGTTLTAHPTGGYMVAGWIGCRQTSGTTCMVVPGTENEDREATAIFLKEGEKGATGNPGSQGPQGNPGATGPQGPSGPAGAKGDTGAQGPQGSAGPQGPPGKVTVSCKPKGKKVTCTVKQAKSAQSARIQRLSWSLHRAGKVVSHGDTGPARLQQVLNHLRPGRYVLHAAGRHGVVIEVG
jgi:hypothetical protein